MSEPFRLTYATMYNPPDHLHESYDRAVADLKANLGKEYGMIINGEERFSDEKFEDTSPVDTRMVLGVFQRGKAQDSNDAVAAAKTASRVWGRLPWQERVDLMRKAAAQIDERIYEFAAVISLEVGKNRMEALADAAETADLIRYACDQMEENNGYIVEMGQDPLVGYTARNVSVLRPYGVWAVISPFNFPAALTGGPAGAALVAGNTVVIKPASDTAFTVRLLAECFRDAGLPAGVFNLVTGGGSSVGQAIIDHPDIDGVTFTGSYDVGMKIYRSFAAGKYPRPTILEMGGKNPAVVSANADLERATAGIVRSAFGLQGQKCSAASRVYVEAPVYDEMIERLREATNALLVGDPTRKEVFMGPVINKWAYNDFKNFTEDLSQSGRFLTGGNVLSGEDFDHGYFCAPTFAIDTPDEHRLWKHEMFLPISMIRKVNNLEEAMAFANDVDYGLTSGIYGSEEEVEWFFDNIESGVTYANRPQGATTGAWPGFQPFGGWKGSGSSGKNAGGHYYLPLYMHEQSRTLIT